MPWSTPRRETILFAALRKFCEWWVDKGQHATCCRSADPEIVESEAEMFDCDSCDFRQQVDALDGDNAEAWRRYAAITAHRWVYDMQAAAWRLEQVFADLDEDEREEAMSRVSIIYDALHPPAEKRRHGA